MSPRMVPLTVCARRAAGLTHQYIAASARLTNITARDLFLPMGFFSILFCRSGVIGPLWTVPPFVTPWTVKLDHKEKWVSMGLGFRRIPSLDERAVKEPQSGLVSPCGSSIVVKIVAAQSLRVPKSSTSLNAPPVSA